MRMRLSVPAGLACVALISTGPSPVSAQPAPVQPAAPRRGGHARFKALYEKEWAWRTAQFAGEDSEDESGVPADHLPRVDAAVQAERLAYWRDVRRQLDAIPQSGLSDEQRVNYQVYVNQIDTLIGQLQFHEYERPFNSDSSFWANLGFSARKPFHTVADYRGYIGQLNDIPRYFDDQIANMRAGLKRGYIAPRVTMIGRDGSISSVSESKTVEDNLFWTPFKAMPASIPAAEQEALKAQARAAISGKVQPAYARLLAFMRNDYMPHATETLAIEAEPDGKAHYRTKIREFTTLDMDPEAIHQLGLAEVAKIHAQMLEVMKETKFEGDFPAFLHFLRTDPQFYPKTGEELLMRASRLAKRVDGKLPAYFGWLPRNRFAIEPVPADLAPFYTGGRGGPSLYMVNTYNLPSRPLYNLTALTLHESAPGHALQMSLAQEQDGLPEFRRQTYISAYGEGWALYCEKLGIEMGMYDTPYDRFGMLTYQMWRAARLVVDTGIHHKGWTRDQAIAFLHDNTALADHEIETEVDRYIAWPAQALSYYLGEMAIVDMRAKAEKALGPKFDIRAFHDTVLSMGSVPLPVMQARIDRFIAEGGRDPMPVSWQKAKQAP